MRLARITHADGVSFAALQSPTTAGGEPDGGDICAEIAEHPFGDPTFTGRTWPLADVRLLAPILPTKVVCIGKNYADHVSEMGGEAPPAPLIFMKPSTTVIGPGVAIQLPPDSQRVDYEGELAIVIGRPCRDVPEAARPRRRPRLHGRQRRHRPGPPAGRRAVDAGEGLRLVLPPRPLDRDDHRPR